VRISVLRRNFGIGCLVLAGLVAVGCEQKPAAPAGAGMQAMPVQTIAVTMAPVAQSNEYVATIKSRRSATLQPQVSGRLTEIRVRSGDHVKSGQVLMEIDPRQQQRHGAGATRHGAAEEGAVRLQRPLRWTGSTSCLTPASPAATPTIRRSSPTTTPRQTMSRLLQLAQEPRKNSWPTTPSVRLSMAWWAISRSMWATTSSSSTGHGSPRWTRIGDLEAYIYIPTERSSQVADGAGCGVDQTQRQAAGDDGKIDFLSPQVDSTSAGILVKAPVHASPEILRNAQMVKARVIWSTTPMAVMPVLAVVRQGGQTFVFVVRQENGHLAIQSPVALGDTVGNTYSISSGLNVGDRVIVSSTQFLVNGMPVMPSRA
jgi:multidrug efflux pump subunit AcrA (membrane-fusion protein)